MISFDEQKLIRIISIFILFIGITGSFLGLASNPGVTTFIASLHTPGFYTNLGFFTLACIIPYAFAKRPVKEKITVLALGACSAVIVWRIQLDSWQLPFWSIANALVSAIGFCLFSIAAIFIDTNPEKKNRALVQHFKTLYLFVFALKFSAFDLVDFTISLHPVTYDSVAFFIDSTMGFYPSVVVARLAGSYPFLKSFLEVVYAWVIVGLPFLIGLQLKQKQTPPANLLLVWAVTTISSVLAYHLCPISGPAYFFGPEIFPNAVPVIDAIAHTPTIVNPNYRNGFPSVHLGTALIMVFAAWHQKSRLLKFIFTVVAILTALSTLSTGEHYLVDLVVAFPYFVAVQSICTHVRPEGQTCRMRAFWTGVALWLMWVILVRYGLVLFQNLPGFTYVAEILTVAASLYLYKQVLPYTVRDHTAPEKNHLSACFGTPDRIGIYAMFFISGLTGLITELVFSKQLSVVFGDMATQTVTVLAIYMGGLAAGAWLGGILVTRSRKSGFIICAVCALSIGAYSLASPALFLLARDLYVHAAQNMGNDLRAGLEGLVLFIPSILMGITLPVMTFELQQRGTTTGRAISSLYGAYSLGAATGALLAGYFLLPLLGAYKTMALSAVCSLAVAFIALKLNKRVAVNMNERPSANEELPKPMFSVSRQVANSALLALVIAGCVTMLMTVAYMHLLAVVAGNSVYAFSLMLFFLLAGSGVGATLARYAFNSAKPTAMIYSLLLFGLASILLVGAFQWNNLPALFAAYGSYTWQLNFSAKEAIRALVCWWMLFPAAVLMGACYPIALELAASAQSQPARIKAAANAISLNTIGNVLGTVTGGLLLIPMIGSLNTIRLCAALCLLAGIVVSVADRRLTSPTILASMSFVIMLFAVQPDSLNYTQLSSGSNIFFAFQHWGEVIDHSESLDGGLSTVSVINGKNQRAVKTLVTNGKFQGNNDLRGEVPAQLGFTGIALLHTVARDNALVIEYGTGVSARAFKEAGFRQLDIVDSSRDLVALSNRHFGAFNRAISAQSGVTTTVANGRNYLLLQNRKYDLISMGNMSVWPAGAASLYNQEFYDLAATRLTESGVLQQWIQLHHMSPVDLACILSTARTVFPIVHLYSIGGQGILIAQKSPDRTAPQAAISLMQARLGLMAMFNEVNLDPSRFSDGLILSSSDTDRLIKSFVNSSEFVISTDDNQFLEYSTPKGNALNAGQSINQLKEFLSRFSSRKKPDDRPATP